MFRPLSKAQLEEKISNKIAEVNSEIVNIIKDRIERNQKIAELKSSQDALEAKFAQGKFEAEDFQALQKILIATVLQAQLLVKKLGLIIKHVEFAKTLEILLKVLNTELEVAARKDEILNFIKKNEKVIFSESPDSKALGDALNAQLSEKTRALLHAEISAAVAASELAAAEKEGKKESVIAPGGPG